MNLIEMFFTLSIGTAIGWAIAAIMIGGNIKK